MGAYVLIPPITAMRSHCDMKVNLCTGIHIILLMWPGAGFQYRLKNPRFICALFWFHSMAGVIWLLIKLRWPAPSLMEASDESP
jgi:hypothetical protein